MLATFIAIALVDRLGRKPIMYAGFAVMGLAMIAVGIFFKSGIETNPSLGYPAIASLLLFIVGFAMSAGPIVWILCSEIFPNSGAISVSRSARQRTGLSTFSSVRPS